MRGVIKSLFYIRDSTDLSLIYNTEEKGYLIYILDFPKVFIIERRAAILWSLYSVMIYRIIIYDADCLKSIY